MFKSNASTQTQFIPFSSVLSDPLLESDPFLTSCHYVVESFARIERDLHVALGMRLKGSNCSDNGGGTTGVELMEPLLLEDHAKFRAATVASRIVQLAQESAMQQLTRISYLIPAYQENAPAAARGREVLQAPMDPGRGDPPPKKTIFFAPVGQNRNAANSPSRISGGHTKSGTSMKPPQMEPQPQASEVASLAINPTGRVDHSSPKGRATPLRRTAGGGVLRGDPRPVSPGASRLLFHPHEGGEGGASNRVHRHATVVGVVHHGDEGMNGDNFRDPNTHRVGSPPREEQQALHHNPSHMNEGGRQRGGAASPWSAGGLEATLPGLTGDRGKGGSSRDGGGGAMTDLVDSINRPAFTTSRAQGYALQYERIIAKSFQGGGGGGPDG